jgi:hypothetical protein
LPGAYTLKATVQGFKAASKIVTIRAQDFNGYSLFFVSQFDGSLEKYLDDFVLNGKKNLAAVWESAIGALLFAVVPTRCERAHMMRPLV